MPVTKRLRKNAVNYGKNGVAMVKLIAPLAMMRRTTKRSLRL
jgi:hypothetical protein